jgi:hypothetical protein
MTIAHAETRAGGQCGDGVCSSGTETVHDPAGGAERKQTPGRDGGGLAHDVPGATGAVVSCPASDANIESARCPGESMYTQRCDRRGAVMIASALPASAQAPPDSTRSDSEVVCGGRRHSLRTDVFCGFRI